jgi:predicted transcriptional regulator
MTENEKTTKEDELLYNNLYEIAKKIGNKDAFKKSNSDGISIFLRRHAFFKTFFGIWVLFFAKRKIKTKDVASFLGISRQWANNMLEKMYKFGILERENCGFYNSYGLKLDTSGEPIINSIIKEHIKEHRDCCIKKIEETMKKHDKNSKLISFIEKNKGD